MTVLALGAIVGAIWLFTVAALLRHIASQTRAHARREDLLLNQLLHATGKPWQPAPADASIERDPVFVPPTWTASPEQSTLLDQ